MPTAAALLAELEKLGKESFRNTYIRHGAGDDVFGVSTADLKALQKKIRKDHDAARGLWKSGNYDARILATMIADPKAMEETTLDLWVRDLDNYPVMNAFAAFVAQTKHARAKAEKWVRVKDEYISSAGWNVYANLALRDKNLPDDYFLGLIETIKRDIKRAPNRTRHEMNGALIAIGTRNAALQKAAIAAARAIGKVEVDHGKTACETPDAESYILKTAGRK